MIENTIVHCDTGGIRLDAALLALFPSSTRAFCREAIAAGKVKVNGRLASKGLKLKGGEKLEVAELAEACDRRVQGDLSVRPVCVFEDDALLAFDKPAGQAVQPISRSEKGTLLNGVVARWPECAEIGEEAVPLMAGAIHRIDAGTSGLVLVARTQAAFDGLRSQFAAQSVEKTYLALVEGRISAGGTLEGELVHDPALDYCRMIDPRRARAPYRGKPMFARTKFTPVAWQQVEAEDRTLLEVVIFTGVTHQIRAQLAMAGMPVVNDRLYGAFAVENMVGHALHSLAAKFVHPVSGDPVEIRTPYPAWARMA